MSPAEMLARFRAAGVKERNIPVALKAAAAGAKGRHATPLTNQERRDRYQVQNGTRREYTARQRRRLVKHNHRVIKRLRGEA